MSIPHGVSFSSFPQFLCFFPLLGAIVPHFFPLLSFLPKFFSTLFRLFIWSVAFCAYFLPLSYPIENSLSHLSVIRQTLIYLLTHISRACRASIILINQLIYQLFIHLNVSRACMTSIDSTLPWGWLWGGYWVIYLTIKKDLSHQLDLADFLKKRHNV